VLTGVPGKTGVVYTLDRETGEFLWARPTIRQNVVHSIDGATGRVTVNPDTVFTEYGKAALVCPAAAGGANYQSGAYSPLTKTMYLPAQNTCSMVTAVEPTGAGPGIYGMAARSFLAEDAGDNLGVIHAVNAVTGRTAWTYAQRAGMQSLMTTGGGLLFAGDGHGRFRALDQETGAVLWDMNLGSSVTGYPATFEVDGHQYVAVSTGRWLAAAYTPELIHGTQNTLFVFALPEAGIGHEGPTNEPIDLKAGVFNAADPDAPANRSTSRKVDNGVYSAAQAGYGKAVYAEKCAVCHGVDFKPAQGTPPVKGEAFLVNWRGKTLGDLYALVQQTMPPGAGNSLSDEDYLASVAYILQENGFKPGEQALEDDMILLQDIGFGK